MVAESKWFYIAMASLFVGFIVVMAIAITSSIGFSEKCEAAGGGVVDGECVSVIELD